jgi:hypothetical protein
VSVHGGNSKSCEFMGQNVIISNLLKTKRGQSKYTENIQEREREREREREKHLTRKKNKEIKTIKKTRNMKTIIGCCLLVKGFEEGL